MPIRPTIADVEEAAARLAGRVWRTPLIPSAWLSAITGGEVFLKLESVQVTGAFKYRGAFNALSRLTRTRPEVRTVVTASAGNHGLAMATAAARLGLNQWKAGVQEKLRTLADIYRVAVEQTSMARGEFLELLVVLILVLELVLLLTGAMRL